MLRNNTLPAESKSVRRNNEIRQSLGTFIRAVSACKNEIENLNERTFDRDHVLSMLQGVFDEAESVYESCRVSFGIDNLPFVLRKTYNQLKGIIDGLVDNRELFTYHLLEQYMFEINEHTRELTQRVLILTETACYPHPVEAPHDQHEPVLFRDSEKDKLSEEYTRTSSHHSLFTSLISSSITKFLEKAETKLLEKAEKLEKKIYDKDLFSFLITRTLAEPEALKEKSYSEYYFNSLLKKKPDEEILAKSTIRIPRS